MTDAEIVKALGLRLHGLHYKIVWEDDAPGLPDLPYLTFELVPTGRIDDTLDGSGALFTGYAQVTVVTKLGEKAIRARDIAEDVAATFPMTLTIATPTGLVTIIRATDVRQGFRDGPNWRIPVRVYYEAA